MRQIESDLPRLTFPLSAPPNQRRPPRHGRLLQTGPVSTTEQPDGITVIGRGAAAATVDRVTISLAVEVVRAEPGAAWTVASGTATRLLATLADDGVDARSVRTSDLTLGPRIEFQGNRQQLMGYQAGQRLTVVRDGLHGIERLLTDVAGLGGEGVRIDGVSLTPGHPQDALNLAREAAFADADAKSRQLATLAGRPLGRVRWIDERPTGGGPRPMMAMRAAVAESMPVATGDAEVGVEITVFREFAD
jgi:uncharacterized protein YggE